MTKAEAEEILRQVRYDIDPTWQPSPLFSVCDDWILAGICLLIVIYIFRAMMKKGV